MSEATIGVTTYDLGEWAPSGRAPSPPPHFLGSDPRHPNELGVVWADERHTIPVAVEDYDGCRAPIMPVPVARLSEGVQG